MDREGYGCIRGGNDKRKEAGYHRLDKSKLPIIDNSVKDLKNMEAILHQYKGDHYLEY